MTSTTKNPFYLFFAGACAIWLVVIGIVVAVIFGAGGRLGDFRIPFLGSRSGGTSASFADNLTSLAYQPLLNAITKLDPNLQIEPVPGKANTFKVTDKESGQTVVLDIAALRQMAQSGGGNAALSQLLTSASPSPTQASATGPATAPADASSSVPVSAPAASADAPADTSAPSVSAATTIAPLPDWVPQPEGSKIVMHTVPPAEGGNGTFLLSSSQSAADVARFLEEKLKALPGYTVQRQDIPTTGGGSGSSVIVATQNDAPNRVIQLTVIGSGSDGTQIAGVYGSGS